MPLRQDDLRAMEAYSYGNAAVSGSFDTNGSIFIGY